MAPVAYEANCLEEVCGACTMLINGRTRQACSALVDKLLADNPTEIELRPMSKFPVIRDLVVDRRRLFRALEKVKAWIPIDTYDDLGSGPRQSQEAQEKAYPLSKCMSCGCCLEACPQYRKIELFRMLEESAEAFAERTQAAHDRDFIGACAEPSRVLQLPSHGQRPCRGAARRCDRRGRNTNLRQSRELPSGMPAKDSLDDVVGPNWACRHVARPETMVRPVVVCALGLEPSAQSPTTRCWIATFSGNRPSPIRPFAFFRRPARPAIPSSAAFRALF